MRRTALFEEHRRLGGKLIDFGGWELPVQYTGIMDEHLACRNACGLFDVSHMGEIHVEGKDAERYLNELVTNDVSKIAVGQAQYTVMCNHQGGIVDDLVIYRRAADRFLVVVNASNSEKDFAHFLSIKKEGSHEGPAWSQLTITDESPNYTQIALQGRQAAQILKTLTQAPIDEVKTYWFCEGSVIGLPTMIARTGYTGEDGFELYVPWDSGPKLWRALLEAGTPLGLKPCGLGARDTLRLEMKYALYGHELSDETNPLETGSGWVVKLAKPYFVGKKAIVAAKEKGLKRSLVGLHLKERGIPRQNYGVYSADGTKPIGSITSGTQSPSLQKSIGIATLDHAYSKIGTAVTVDIRGTKVPAEIVATPFYKRNY